MACYFCILLSSGLGECIWYVNFILYLWIHIPRDYLCVWFSKIVIQDSSCLKLNWDFRFQPRGTSRNLIKPPSWKELKNRIKYIKQWFSRYWTSDNKIWVVPKRRTLLDFHRLLFQGGCFIFCFVLFWCSQIDFLSWDGIELLGRPRWLGFPGLERGGKNAIYRTQKILWISSEGLSQIFIRILVSICIWGMCRRLEKGVTQNN